MSSLPPLLVILGPTASGKSALAIALARRCGAEIVSVDSMQVYQSMDIGTAKPSLAEQHEIRHHLVNWIRPDETFSVARFVEIADGIIADAAGRHMPLIATGGTPLYYKSLFFGLFNGPGADPAVRERLGALGGAELHERLSRVDPVAAARIHQADQRRLIRALEIYELTGHPISSLQTEWSANAANRHSAVWFGLRWDTEAINRRINGRVKDMIAAGWVDEVRELVRRYPSLSKTAAEATGYCQLIEHLAGRLSLEDAVEQIKISTRQLARKQMKWFKRFPGVHWMPGDRPMEEHVDEILRRCAGTH